MLKPTPYVMKVLYCMEFYGHMHFTHSIQKLERLFEESVVWNLFFRRYVIQVTHTFDELGQPSVILVCCIPI